MYIQHSVHINQPAEECSAALARGPRTWFPRLNADNASEVGLRVAGVSVRKRVIVELGEPEKKGEWTDVPITWKATFPERLFPVLVGRLELVPVEKNVTRLTVSGMYQPPLGRLGTLIDDAIMHSVAEATVREVTEAIAVQLDSIV
ncbi:MAG TPA: hypothetical protein VFO75_02910 [Candidatus Dormibacteraeota bacterium]|nr:hypothetical protein [Candidatus Dormibacteraeota bacterium]